MPEKALRRTKSEGFTTSKWAFYIYIVEIAWKNAKIIENLRKK